MLTIKKVRADHVIDFAAEELKKYLRMMMPECGEIDICYDPTATDGFRLGLLSDFGLPSEAEDPRLDDIIHIDTTKTGGILAGSNPRSVLFSVYRFLRENGCRWLYPSIDGDYVPMQDIEGVNYHKMADHRFRGFCNEGSEIQYSMLECADYYAKLEMNVYMLEWFIPNGYYNRYYSHLHNDKNRIPETVSDTQVLQWKRQCETEIAKRGLMFHDIGHGWTCRPFGFPDSNSVNNIFDLSAYTEEEKQVLALVGGKRDFFHGNPFATNLCMSRPDVRRAMVREVADYAAMHKNIDYLHVWLSDGSYNHCECEECRKMIPSDWYIMLMNEIDEELSSRNLDTRIVFIAYLDTIFAPEVMKLNNPERFALLYAPITRSYTQSITEDTVPVPTEKYVRNNWKRPTDMAATLSILRAWQKVFPGMAFSYEYHFWRHQYLDPGGVAIARRLYDDVRSLKVMGLSGYVEDGSQRSGFPNAFPVYIYAETLMTRDCDFEAVKADYFSHIYGEDYSLAVSLLEKISDAFDFSYMEGECSKDKEISLYYDPNRTEKLAEIPKICKELRALAEEHLIMPTRPETISWRLLTYHSEYCELWCEILMKKAVGEDVEARNLAREFCDKFGVHEVEIERYYDHSLACRVLEHITKNARGIIID